MSFTFYLGFDSQSTWYPHQSHTNFLKINNLLTFHYPAICTHVRTKLHQCQPLLYYVQYFYIKKRKKVSFFFRKRRIRDIFFIFFLSSILARRKTCLLFFFFMAGTIFLRDTLVYMCTDCWGVES